MNIEALQERLRRIPDFPKPGINFVDIAPLLQDTEALRAAVQAVAAPFAGQGVERVVGIESRGFVLGAPVALELGVGFGLIRKKGKLPWRTHSVEYALEYGSDSMEMHQDAVEPGQRVLVVDDLLATGGTAAAAVALLRKAGASALACTFLIELEALEGRKALDIPCHRVIGC